jgi:DNA-binding protein HU-beta
MKAEKMHSEEIIAAMAEESGLSKKDCKTALAAFTATVKKALSEGKGVNLIGFGSFKPVKKEARKGRNPTTGAEIEISEKVVPVFKAGSDFKAVVKG